MRVRRVPQERPLPAHPDQVLILELVEVMGEGGRGNLQFFLNVADHQPLRVSGQEKLHDAQPGFGPHGGEHVGVARDSFGGFVRLHVSIMLELRNSASDFSGR